MNWSDFEKQCLQVTLEVLKDFFCQCSCERVYAVALYTDSSAMSVSLSANTEEKLKNILDKEEDKSRENISYFRWDFSEWSYEGYKAEQFSKISKALRDSQSRDDFNKFKKELLKALTNVLKMARQELSNEMHEVVGFVSISDDEQSEQIEEDSAKIINSKKCSIFL